MTATQRPTRFGRRGFLRAVALSAVAGSAAALPGVAAQTGTPIGQSAAPLTVGVLLPPAQAEQRQSEQLLLGMRALFAETGERIGRRAVRIVVEHGAFGAGVVAAATRLLDTAGADILVGLANPTLAAALHPLLSDRGRMLILSNTGANIPRSRELSPNVVHHSLAQWQASWALGAWAAQTLGTRGFMAMSFYDSGYDTPYAFRAGFAQAGGALAGESISHRPRSGGDLGPLMAQIEAARPDFVYAAYWGQAAIDFVRAYRRAGLRAPLIGSSFLVDSQTLPTQGRAALGIYTAAPWARESVAPRALGAAAGRAPEAFALLGYEAAQLVAAAGRGAELDQLAQVRAALEGDTIASPRGVLQLSAANSALSAPVFLQQVRREGLSLANVSLGRLGDGAEADPQIQQLRAQVRSGWLNGYMLV